ncbi:MAG: hypothetical protein WCE61_05450 [Candidatus Acidiferrum sp.]
MNRVMTQKLGRLCPAFLLCTLVPTTLASQIRGVNQLTGELSMGPGFTRSGGTCIAFGALLSAGEFFQRLRVEKTATGLEYWNGPRRVTKFPSELTINVLTYIWACDDPDKANKEDKAEASSAGAVLQNLQWVIQWKTGMKTRPVARIDLKLNRSSADEFAKRVGTRSYPALPKEGSEIWNVTLAIHEQDAPLSDSLVLIVTTNGGKQVARFSGHL